MSTVMSRALAALSVLLASFSFGPAFAQQLPGHVLFHSIAPLPAEADTGPPNFEPLDNEFGAEVAIRDGFAFAGMPKTNATGQVAVFTQQGTSGRWIRTATLVASDRSEGDDFGRALSYRDGLLIVGSHRAAYVYKRRVDGSWRQQQKVVTGASDVMLDLKHEAGVLVIGARNDTISPPFRVGLLYIFERNAAGTFVQRARIVKTASEHGFGHQVAMTKREIVVGSSGSAFIFGRNSSGNWAQRQKLLPANPDTLDFGGAVAIDRGMILVGAPNTLGPHDRQGGTLHGFVPGTSKYVEIFEIQSPRGRLVSFGNFIAMFGNRIAVSAERWMDNPEPAAPALVLTFTRDGSSIRPLGEVQFGSFPAPIAIANNVLMVGSPIEGMCRFLEFGCVGRAGFFDLNRLQ